jgi:phosphopantetheinyl transferase (holo-ACP synthase)
MKKKIRVNNNLTWKELKGLNELFASKKSTAKVQGYPYFKYLIEDANILEQKEGNKGVILSTEQFEDFYNDNYEDNFKHYIRFLKENDLESDARRNYSESDIKSLMFIAKNKEQIIPKLSTINTFSGEFFHRKGAKYLASKESVLKAVYTILGITQFPAADPKENQWRFVVDNPNPKAVVLCENQDFLKTPWRAETLSVKLWYVGGNNIRILDQIDISEFKYPFYYCCDWDLHGLKIYSRIKKKLDAKQKSITLLFPDDPTNTLPTNVLHHNSRWDFSKELSGLTASDFNSEQLALIQELISKDEWIEEETTNLIEMMSVYL